MRFLNHTGKAEPVDSKHLLQCLLQWSPQILDSINHPEERAGVRMTLEEHVQQLEEEHWCQQHRSGTLTLPMCRVLGFKHSAECLVSCLRFCRFLVGGARVLADVVEFAARIILAEDQAKGLQLTRQLPSATLLRYYQLQLDTSIMLTEREKAAQHGPRVRYGWTDASPQANYDWLWIQSKSLAQSDIMSAFVLAAQLKINIDEQVNVAMDSNPDDWHERPIHPTAEMLDALEKYESMFEYHVHPPVAVTSGFRGLSHKASAMLYSYVLELPSPNHLRAFCESYISHTSDMGVEMGLPEFEVPAAGHVQLLPSWMQDDMVGDGAPVTAVPGDRLQHCSGRLLRNALPIAGMQHLIFNLLADVDQDLEFFPSFWEELKMWRSS